MPPGRNTPMPVATLHAVNGHSMTNVPDGMEIAIFCDGLFRGVERLFWQLPGVYSTAAGYTGGYTPNPTYREVCPAILAMPKRCALFTIHPSSAMSSCYKYFGRITIPPGMRQGNDHSTQYRSAIYPLTPEQDAAARQSGTFSGGDACRR